MRNTIVEFITISPYFTKVVSTQFISYIPIILMDDEYDENFGIGVGKSINLEPLPNKADALEAARIACLSMPGAIGYAVRGVDHE